MKSSKESVFEFIQRCIYSSNEEGVETKNIAEALNMQRSNVSSLLNELVKEEKLIKTNTRPVLYQLPQQTKKKTQGSCFSKLVGNEGTLRNAIQLSKAAILYPAASLNILISSKVGCGTTSFAKTLYQFAKESNVIQEGTYIKINCKHFNANLEMLDDELFGHDDLNKSAFIRAQGGLLFIDHADLLSAKQLNRIFDFIDTRCIHNETSSILCSNIILVLACSPQNTSLFNRKIPVTIDLPELKQYSLEERFAFIHHFFNKEAVNSSRCIEVSKETMQALLCGDFPYNIKELYLEIKMACANAYVRVVNEKNYDIRVCVNDLKDEVQRNQLKFKGMSNEIREILGNCECFFFDKEVSVQYNETSASTNMYSEIKKQYERLMSSGINSSSVENVIDTHIKGLFKKYRYYNDFDEKTNLEQLSKIVDPRIIKIVSSTFKDLQLDLGRNYKSSVIYGLCLHINSLFNISESNQRIDNKEIIRIIEEYPKEYLASVQLCESLKDAVGLNLAIDEIVIITMFLIENDEIEEEHPVLLYIMHGDSTASSLANVSNTLTHCENAYSYDLNLQTDSKTAMEEIKNIIIRINRGPGIFVIYDMGSIKTMVDAIQEELEIPIRMMNIPITLIGIDVARKCSMENDLDYVYHMANLEMNGFTRTQENRNALIITLCHTGEGGAVQLKRYIDQYSKLGIKTISLSISKRPDLLKEVLTLKKTYRLHAFVGTYDPRLFGVPFIPIAKIFENRKEDLDRILMFEPLQTRSFDFSDVYKYLEEQFKYTSIVKLKTVLPEVVDDFSLITSLSEDQKLGLFMHIACLIERLLDGSPTIKNKDKKKILSVFEEEYKIVSKIMSKIEKAFKIIIDEDEITTIIMILKQI